MSPSACKPPPINTDLISFRSLKNATISSCRREQEETLNPLLDYIQRTPQIFEKQLLSSLSDSRRLRAQRQPLALPQVMRSFKSQTDGSTFNVTLDMVKSLPLAQLTAEGKVEEGPYLLDVLALPAEFTEVTLTGSSNRPH
jgi:hypothetical protein